MSNQIPSSFLKHIPKGDEKTYIEYYECESTRQIRKILCKVAKDKIETAMISSEKKTKYSLPSWSEYQADELGYRRALREVVAMLENKGMTNDR